MVLLCPDVSIEQAVITNTFSFPCAGARTVKSFASICKGLLAIKCPIAGLLDGCGILDTMHRSQLLQALYIPWILRINLFKPTNPSKIHGIYVL